MADQYKTREERRKQQSNRAQKQKPKPKRKRGGLFKKIILALFIIGLAGVIAGAGVFAYYAKDAPDIDDKMLADPIASEVLDMNGKPYTMLGSENRDYVDYDDIPKEVEDAVLATEDVRFYKHGAIDIRRLAGAVLANVTRGFGSEGASTLTQQVVKRSFLSDEKTLKRKAQEAWLAVKLEKKYSKQQIFEIYVNKIYYGNGIHGIETASKYYFNKELKDLTLTERAFLAGLPQRPNGYDPYENPELADKRKDIVLSLMKQHGKITEQQMKEAKAVSVMDTLVPEDQNQTIASKYDSFIDQVIREVEKMGDYNVFSDGLKIYTTIDPEAQEFTDKMMLTDEVIQYPDEKMQAGIVLMDTKSGEVRAIGGNRNKEVKRGRNFATQLTERNPGSTIKPILDYGPAIEYLNWSTYEQIVDEPYKYSNGTPVNNFDQRHLGQMSIREALYRSRNIPALKAFEEVGSEKAMEFASNLGLDLKAGGDSASIGSVTNISPMQLAAAYATFGNSGIYNEPHTITKIVLRDGETEVKNKVAQKSAMKDSTAYMITDMLKDVLSNKQGATGKQAIIPGLPAAGKTGTTNYSSKEIADYNLNQRTDVPDSWFAGYTTNYSVAVWTGYENRKTPVSGDEQKIAQRMYRSLMEKASANVDTPDFKMPSSVVKAAVEKGSNPASKPSAHTPKDQIVYELFVAGTEPKQVSKNFDEIEAPSVTGEFRQAENEVAFSWNYSGDSEEYIEYDVSITVNGETHSLGKTDDTEYTIQNVQPGETYTIEVTALVDGQRSKPGRTSVTVPDLIDDEDNGNTPDDEGIEEEDPDDDEGQGNPDMNNGQQPPQDNSGQPNGDGSQEQPGNNGNPNGNQGEGNSGNNNGGSDAGQDGGQSSNSSQNNGSRTGRGS